MNMERATQDGYKASIWDANQSQSLAKLAFELLVGAVFMAGVARALCLKPYILIDQSIILSKFPPKSHQYFHDTHNRKSQAWTKPKLYLHFLNGQHNFKLHGTDLAVLGFVNNYLNNFIACFVSVSVLSQWLDLYVCLCLCCCSCEKR